MESADEEKVGRNGRLDCSLPSGSPELFYGVNSANFVHEEIVLSLRAPWTLCRAVTSNETEGA